jgi:hypothetical protein
MKRINNIVVSNTEPSVNSLWITNNTIKWFGKSGWEGLEFTDNTKLWNAINQEISDRQEEDDEIKRQALTDSFIEMGGTSRGNEYWITYRNTNRTISGGASHTDRTLTIKTASSTENGMMSFSDKAKLDSIDVTTLVNTVDGLIPAAYLPSYVDDVLEYSSVDTFPETGEAGKIYVDTTTNLTYRWTGTQYIEISKSLGLGETASAAYPGDKGKQNADNITTLQTQVGSNNFSSSNYLSKETNLTDAVLQLDGEIKATNDNLSLEHEYNSATYATKDEIKDTYLPLAGGTMTGNITFDTFESTPVGNVGDAVLYDKQADKLIIVPTTDDIGTKYPSDNYEPIGVVVIPASHDVYDTGECGVMSLKEMNYNSPDSGSTSYQNIYWGGHGDDISLPDLDQVPTGNTSNGIPTGQTSYAYLPSDKFSGTQCAHDTDSYYHSPSDTPIPSPYLTDGSRNPGYYQTSSPSSSSNALADFDGIGNSQVLWDSATSQSDWKTANSITNTYAPGYYPAACCCWRYHTEGTSQGDWYLPACGELGYIMPPFNKINDAIGKMRTAYGSSVGVELKTDINYYWSSTKYNSLYARRVGTHDGYVGHTNKNFYNFYNYVRAFLRVLPTSNSTGIIISGKSETDLLNAAGGTTSINSIIENLATKNEVDQAISEAEFNIGCNTITSLSDIPITKKLIIANIDSDQSFSIDPPSSGREINIIIHNTSSTDIIITIPTSNGYIAMTGEELSIAGNSYGEINIISDGTNRYIRAV